VFVVDKTQKVKMTSIEIGATLSESFIVSSGLKIGETIVLEGTQSLRDGDIIKVKPTIINKNSLASW